MKILLSLLAGGLATSLAEFFLHYNLVDLVVDKIKALFGAAKADLKAKL